MIYNTKGGKLHGPYETVYSDGEKRGEGSFKNGHRKGEWIIYDREGDTIVQRYYKSPYVFEQDIPTVPEDGPFELLSNWGHAPDRNEQGVLERSYAKKEPPCGRFIFIGRSIKRIIPVFSRIGAS